MFVSLICYLERQRVDGGLLTPRCPTAVYKRTLRRGAALILLPQVEPQLDICEELRDPVFPLHEESSWQNAGAEQTSRNLWISCA